MVAGAQNQVTPLDLSRDSEVCVPDVCPVCAGSQWVKAFTPWGCPESQRCPRCNAALKSNG